MQLRDGDIQTREVLGWNGVHLLNFAQSSCSQKIRILLNLKGIAWESHWVDLMSNENISPWFLGINPRGLVPVLVHDGAVHIESNDILVYLDKVFANPPLIPAGMETQIGELLRHEDDLHLDLRNLSLRFVFAPKKTPKPASVLETYATAGSGLVAGQKDAGLDEQLDYWRRYAADNGITDTVARISAQRFRAAFDDLESRLVNERFLTGDTLSVVDIAWFIYVDRLTHAGYPFARLHPHVAAWFARLSEQPAFAREREVSSQLQGHVAAIRQAQATQTLEAVAGF